MILCPNKCKDLLIIADQAGSDKKLLVMAVYQSPQLVPEVCSGTAPSREQESPSGLTSLPRGRNSPSAPVYQLAQLFPQFLKSPL